MIFSAGVDIAYITRLAKYVNNNAFLDRLLADKEREYIFTKRTPCRHLAGRFAAKEAVMKALGTGWNKGVSWRDIEIVDTPSGSPIPLLHARAASLLQNKKIFLSLAYAKDIAVAVAVIE